MTPEQWNTLKLRASQTAFIAAAGGLLLETYFLWDKGADPKLMLTMAGTGGILSAAFMGARVFKNRITNGLNQISLELKDREKPPVVNYYRIQSLNVDQAYDQLVVLEGNRQHIITPIELNPEIPKPRKSKFERWFYESLPSDMEDATQIVIGYSDKQFITLTYNFCGTDYEVTTDDFRLFLNVFCKEYGVDINYFKIHCNELSLNWRQINNPIHQHLFHRAFEEFIGTLEPVEVNA